MKAKITPMMKQYLEVKKQHPDKIVFFRMGDFYEMFFDDARSASRVLGITLTSRDKGENPIPMAGVPHHSVEPYLRKFLSEGHKVVICDQVEEASQAVGLVKREVTRIITPGTYFSDKDENAESNVFLGCLTINGEDAGVSLVDLSTGEFFADTMTERDAIEEMAKMGISECLVSEGEEDRYRKLVREIGQGKITVIPAWNFDFKAAYEILLKHFRVTTLKGFGYDEREEELSIIAAGVVMQYLIETQKNDMAHIVKITHLKRDDILHVDRTTQVHLELIQTQMTKEKKGSLLGVLDFTQTAMGRRKLQQFILHPVTDCKEIFLRQEAVREFKENDFYREEIKELLKGISDVERLASKISCMRCNARDLMSLKNSLKTTRLLKDAMGAAFSERLIRICEELEQDGYVIDLIEKRIMEDPPLQLTESGIINDGVNHELDELRSISRDGKKWIADYQQKERKRTGIEKLRIGFNKVFGYYVEVTNLHKNKVPEDYIRKQTLTNAERFITPALKEYEEKVLSAEEKIKKIEYNIFSDTRDLVAERIKEILTLASFTAELDVYFSLGTAAYRYGYTAPVVNNSSAIEIQGGKHPVLLQAMPEGKFVSNDLFVDTEKEMFLIITGPNMAGKSTYIRQVAVLVLMAQMGSFIPVQKATVGVVDRIFTRIGASDEISRGQSTFMVEMTEVANILNNATERSLVILDEVGRGTSTFDGVSIAWAIAEYLMGKIKARVLFATHYHELTELAMTHTWVKNLNVSVKEWNDQIIFLHKIVEGISDRSYGIHVAAIAGLPREVINRAKEVLENLELSSVGEDNRPKLAERKAAEESKPVQLSIFDMNNEKVIKKIRGININAVTPLEALNILSKLKEDVG